ncbi:Replication termination protein [Brevibacillus laterosporus]|uniref:Replication termination protein n=1 Tax=Brevibacillus laterosporus TaxID=1465 RepID=UPI00265342F3|nr:Replication termination protein [Brevibacillus laterosporus]MDN9011606.1 Replication termination protein [Brevibacillus laterosporus]MDO0942571.1 Replication termination protein [Brevibacillus laterosporus]
MSERESTGFLMKQRAFLKLYLITMVEKKKGYALQMLDILQHDFKNLGYRPNHAEIYRSLDDLVEDGILYRVKKLQPNMNSKHKEVVYYHFVSDGGYETAMRYKANVKADLDRCIKILRKAVADNY